MNSKQMRRQLKSITNRQQVNKAPGDILCDIFLLFKKNSATGFVTICVIFLSPLVTNASDDSKQHVHLLYLPPSLAQLFLL